MKSNSSIITKMELQRRKLGLTQKALARRAGFSNSLICRFESGRLPSVSLNFKRRISRVLGVSQKYLFDQEDSEYD